MQLITGKPIAIPKKPKNIFHIVVNTMEGDADDYHTVEIDVPTAADVLKLYEQYQVIKEQDTDEYDQLPFFDGSIWEKAIYFNCDSCRYDELESFIVTWFDENHIEYSVDIV